MPSWLLYSYQFLGIYYTILFFIYVLLIWKSSRQVQKDAYENEVLEHLITKEKNYPSFSIIIPAHNEELNIYSSVMAYLKLNYSHFEVIVVDDGSNDKTVDILKNKFKLSEVELEASVNLANKELIQAYQSTNYSNLIVLTQENGRKGSAVNQGISYAKNDWVCVVDADTIPEVDTLYKMALYILNHPDHHGVGCSLRISNGSKLEDFSIGHGDLPVSFIENFQIIEYIRSFYGGRIGWDSLNATILLSGAFSALRKELVYEVGGFSHDSIVEDLDFIFKCYNVKGNNLKLKIHPEPLAWTQAPADYHSLISQRLRWQRGLIQTMSKYSHFLFNSEVEKLSLVQYPFLIFGIILEPFIELFSLFVMIYSYINGYLLLSEIFVLLGVTLFLVILLNLSCLSIEENYFSRNKSWRNRLRISFFAVFEIVFYHQLMTLVNIYAFYTAFNDKREWGFMRRKTY